MSRRARLGAAGLAVVLVLAGAAAGFVGWRALRGRDAPYHVSLRPVAPATTNAWVPGQATCPTGGRGSSPAKLAIAAAGQSARRVPQVGPGQILAYELLVEAGNGAPDLGDLAASMTFPQPLSARVFDPAGVVCTFVDDADPLTTSVGAQATSAAVAPATSDDGDIRADVRVTGLEAGSSAVVEMWVRAATELDRSTAVLSSEIVSVTAPTGSRAEILESSARMLRSASTGRAPVALGLELADETPVPGGAIRYLLAIRNTSDDQLANHLSVRLEADPTVSLGDVSVTDRSGLPTTCTRRGTEITCATPYLVPGEEVLVLVDGVIAADTPTMFQTAGAKCTRHGQDVCTRAEITALGGVLDTTGRVELATDLPAKETLGITKLAADPEAVLYVGQYADFTYAVVPGKAAATDVAVIDPSCGPVTLISGDDGADHVLSPGERWIYRCSAVVDRSQAADVSVTAVAASGEPIGATGRLAAPVLDPSVTLRPVETTDDRPGLEILNSGDAELSDVVVQGRACNGLEATGDGDNDGVLDPTERWILPCEQRTGPVRVYATDQAGGAVTASVT